MEPNKQAFGYVIRKDGTIPWDDDPDRHPGHKGAVLQDLLERGHTVVPHPDNPNHYLVQDFTNGLKAHPRDKEA